MQDTKNAQLVALAQAMASELESTQPEQATEDSPTLSEPSTTSDADGTAAVGQ